MSVFKRRSRLLLPLCNQMIQRADGLRLAAERRMRTFGRCPAEDVEMRPALRIGDETLEEEVPP